MQVQSALILAAGKGTRMHSDKPKVLQNLLGDSMLSYVINALQPIFAHNIYTVIGHKADLVQKAIGDENIHYVWQKEQLGTGHALIQALPHMQDCQSVFVINGDTPLISTELVQDFLEKAKKSMAQVAFASITLDDIGAYGRVVRKAGQVQAIVEAKDYDENIHGSISHEVNAGLYYFDIASIKALLPDLERLSHKNKSGEYYITDLVHLALKADLKVQGIECGNNPLLLGINSPVDLAKSESYLRYKIVEEYLQAGVLMHAPELISIAPSCKVEAGAEIYGPCEIYGHSHIERGVIIDSHCVIKDSHIKQNAHIHNFSHLQNAIVSNNSQVGPYARLRPGAELLENVKVGNFVEVKKSILGKGAKASHLTYLGDAIVGEDVNIGAGTITCNYDGKNKFQTNIGAKAFIGSNTALVAPVNIGENALIGAGSVITKDVPEQNLGLTRAKQKNYPRKA